MRREGVEKRKEEKEEERRRVCCEIRDSKLFIRAFYRRFYR
jgi:hypothetical protein